MTRLTVGEFQELCKKIRARTYIFNSGNQSNGEMWPRHVDIEVRFTTMFIPSRENRICFMSDSDHICFNKVQYVDFDEDLDGNLVGFYFDIVCEDGTFTMLADN